MSRLIISRPEKWKEMVNSSRRAVDDFNDFADDNAIIWADSQIKSYRQAMQALIQGNGNWRVTVNDEQARLVDTLTRRSEAL